VITFIVTVQSKDDLFLQTDVAAVSLAQATHAARELRKRARQTFARVLFDEGDFVWVGTKAPRGAGWMEDAA
jgi:hypothetical protein